MGVDSDKTTGLSHHAITKDDIPEDDGLTNIPAKGISYFTPEQSPRAGTALGMLDGSSEIPKLFRPLKLRGLEMQNRIGLSPMCQYSADHGHHTDWHLTHLGGIIQRGPGLTMAESTSVQKVGLITPFDSGLWKDSQILPLRKITEFAHSQNQKIGIQLGHAGRKASTIPPWLSKGDTAQKEHGGWPDEVVAPSAVAFSDKYPHPKEMSKQDIEEFKIAYKEAVKRALKAGFDTIEVHAAHGYLLHQFLSPISNKRTDEYGGSFENRTRLTLEIVDITRKTIPDDMPLLVRVSASDWLEEAGLGDSWTLDQTVRLAELLADRGVDLLDVSSGGLHPGQQIKAGPGYQVHFGKAVKEKVGNKMHISTVGSITTGKQANDILEQANLDVVFIGRQFQKNPGLVWTFADDLGVEGRWANQIRWGFGGRGKE